MSLVARTYAMPVRHRLILLAATAFCAVALLCPLGVRTSTTAALSPLASAAPPLFDAAGSPAGDDNAVMSALRREANLALGQLRGRELP